MYKVGFGHIPMRLDLCFSLGQVRSREPIMKDWLATRAHPEDRYYYPPVVHHVDEGPGGESVPIPYSQRTAHLHRLPATHDLVLWDDSVSDQAIRSGIAGFTVHFLGFVTGYRTQFEDWWFDGRVSTKCETDAEPHVAREVGAALEHAVAAYHGLAERDRRVLTNALFMHNRAPMYEWPWERFVVQYQVFDALFRVAHRHTQVPDNGHGKRLRSLAEHYGLYFDDERARVIVNLRNDLFHETLWAEESMPTAGGGSDGFYSQIWLRHINQRLAFAVLGFTGPYISSSWHSLLTHFLDLDQLARSGSS